MNAAFGILSVVLVFVAGIIIAIFGAIVLVKVLKLIGELIAHILRFVLGMISDTLRAVGAVVLSLVLAPLILLNVVIGRWSASAHFGRALKNEIKTVFVSLYRVAIGHPFRLIGLAGVTEGLEQRLPEVMAAAPGPDKPSKKRLGMFDGYTIIGSLPGGGSGGKLYIAEPDELKMAGFARHGAQDVDQVVIKSFSLRDGSSLPQIVRESRALDAAKKLGLVLEHELTDERFFYVMRYVPGESLSAVTTRMHGLSPTEGLSDHYLRSAMGYASDLLQSLNTYHRGGLWHKDVKPDNIIVDGNRAHLVDFGLVTPLRSAMTLTTHGTEYFRDPELVRQALRGVKVHQIDGSKFDVYAAGAVLYSVLENSFPAHGGLSQITKRCPDALRWIVRRAMTDYDKRYESASQMLADLEAVLAASDPFKVRPADLPSMTDHEFELNDQPEPVFATASAATPVPPPIPTPAPAQNVEAAASKPKCRPKLRVNHWWTGKYAMAGVVAVADGKTPAAKPDANGAQQAGGKVPNPVVPPENRAKAADQIRSARARAASRRRAAQQRMAAHRSRHKRGHGAPAGINAGVAAGLLIAFFMLAGVGAAFLLQGTESSPASPRNGDSIGTVLNRDGHSVIYQTSPEAPDAPNLAVPSEPATTVEAISDTGKYDLASLSGRKILVVSDLGTPMDPTIKTQLKGVLHAARKVGASIVGDGAVLIGDDSSDAANVDLVASVEAARGQRPMDASDLFSTLRDWMSEHADIDILVWLSPPGPGRDGVVYTIMTPETLMRGSANEDLESSFIRSLNSAAFDI